MQMTDAYSPIIETHVAGKIHRAPVRGGVGQGRAVVDLELFRARVGKLQPHGNVIRNVLAPHGNHAAVAQRAVMINHIIRCARAEVDEQRAQLALLGR